MKTKTMNIFIVLLLTLSFLSCNTNEPENNDKPVLTVEDVSCTEAWLKISNAKGSLITLKRDDKEIMQFKLTGTDTVVLDNSLLPNKTYKYQVFRIQNPVSGIQVSATTMDTTSHNFTWQTFTFGNETSVLFDVVIINENNIWIVGEIYKKDSLGILDPVFYNLARWDGNKWTLERVYYYYQGSYSLAHLKSIFAFSNNSISLGGFFRSNGDSFESIPLNISFSSEVNKIWGQGSKDYYIAGNNGNIAHYKDGFWQKIESGTTSDLLDIYGNEQNIFIAGYRDFKPSALLKVENGIIKKIIEDENNLFNYRTDFISGAIYSVWLTKNKLFTTTSFDLYRSDLETDGKAEAIWKGAPQDWGMISLRGNDVNDIIACGAFGRIWHFNGITWKKFNELENNSDRLYRIEIKGNICIAVGYRYENGIERYGLVRIGRR